MSKAIEDIKKIAFNIELNGIRCFGDEFRNIIKELKRLEAIDNSNPSEALKELKHWKETNNENGVVWIPLFAVEDIEQALIKAQKQEDKAKAFDLIDTKNVDIKLLKWAYPSVEAYNVKVREHKDSFPREELTKEEFDFLGRMVGAK